MGWVGEVDITTTLSFKFTVFTSQRSVCQSKIFEEHSLLNYLFLSVRRNSWIHAFLKGIGVKWNRNTSFRIWTCFAYHFSRCPEKYCYVMGRLESCHLVPDYEKFQQFKPVTLRSKSLYRSPYEGLLTNFKTSLKHVRFNSKRKLS